MKRRDAPFAPPPGERPPSRSFQGAGTLRRSWIGLLTVALAGLLAAAAIAAATPPREDSAAAPGLGGLTAQAELERQVLQAERGRFHAAASARDAAATRLGNLLTAWDAAVAGGAPDTGAEALEARTREIAVARDQHAAALARCAEIAEQVRLTLERIQILDQRIALLKGRRKPAEEFPLTGHWEVSFLPTQETGTFDLVQDGTLVTGQYSLRLPETGSPEGYEPAIPSARAPRERSGSLRGTFAGGKLTLQRVDGPTGKYTELEGYLSGETLRGTWQNDELADAKLASGSWSAVRRED